jgi:hypothetical protein
LLQKRASIDIIPLPDKAPEDTTGYERQFVADVIRQGGELALGRRCVLGCLNGPLLMEQMHRPIVGWALQCGSVEGRRDEADALSGIGRGEFEGAFVGAVIVEERFLDLWFGR